MGMPFEWERLYPIVIEVVRGAVGSAADDATVERIAFDWFSLELMPSGRLMYLCQIHDDPSPGFRADLRHRFDEYRERKAIPVSPIAASLDMDAAAVIASLGQDERQALVTYARAGVRLDEVAAGLREQPTDVARLVERVFDAIWDRCDDHAGRGRRARRLYDAVLQQLDDQSHASISEGARDQRRFKTYREALLGLEREMAVYIQLPAPVFGRCYWIPDLDAEFGLERSDRGGRGWHPWIVVGGTVGRHTPILVCPRTTSRRSVNRDSFPIGSADLPGLEKDGWLQLGNRRSLPPNRFGSSYPYVSDVAPKRRSELWRKIREMYGG